MGSASFDPGKLSARETGILGLAIEGMTDVQISQRLGITPSTVNSYWVRIRGKLGQFSRTELVALSLKRKSLLELTAANVEINTLKTNAKTFATMSDDFANSEIYRAALEAMPEAVFVTCHLAIVRFANSRLEKMFGYEPGGLVGVSALDLIPFRLRQAEADRIAQYLKDPTPFSFGLKNVAYAQKKNGSQFRVVVLIDSQMTSTGPILSVLVRDFTSELETRMGFASAWKSSN